MAVRGAKELQRQLAMLSKEAERTIVSGLRELSFHVKESVERETATKLNYVSANTRRFIADFYIRYSTKSGVFKCEIGPRPRSAELIARHSANTTMRARDKNALTHDGKIAVPITVKKGKSGKVPKRQTPAELLLRRAKGRSRGFVTKSGKAIIQRDSGGGTSVAFGLVDSAKVPDRLDLDVVAREQWHAHAETAFRNAMKRAAQRAGVKGG